MMSCTGINPGITLFTVLASAPILRLLVSNPLTKSCKSSSNEFIYPCTTPIFISVPELCRLKYLNISRISL